MKAEYDLVPILRRLYIMYFEADGGVGDAEAAIILGLTRHQVRSVRQRMTGIYQVSRGKYSCRPDDMQIQMARAILQRADFERRKSEFETAIQNARNPFNL